MTWMKKIDRTKFPREGMVVSTWSKDSREWICAIFPQADVDCDPMAIGGGKDPVEAMLDACVQLGALADTGEWAGDIAETSGD
jgi:hypothetical protein